MMPKLVVRGEEWPQPEIRQVPYWEVESLWSECGPMLKKAIDRQTYWTIEGIHRILNESPMMNLTNQMQLWYCKNRFSLVTQIQINGDGSKTCLLFLCGGEDLNAIQDAFLPVKEWAKKHFCCTGLRIVGREGWLKILPGFRKTEVIMECEI